MLAWRHSGFSVHHAIRAEPWDTAGLERLCRYLVHPPIAVERLRYDGAQAAYRGRRVHAVSGEQAVTLDPLDMLARLCQRMPPPGMHLTRLYGAYPNRTRGARARWPRCVRGRGETCAIGSGCGHSGTPRRELPSGERSPGTPLAPAAALAAPQSPCHDSSEPVA